MARRKKIEVQEDVQKSLTEEEYRAYRLRMKPRGGLASIWDDDGDELLKATAIYRQKPKEEK